ncbi:TetR/AcrR family transcriptional regulator [Deinococcus lacus]|uniref:TetR/AcrR family transcriptional regulator n=1 Tax=Deinococcus lacus TaxID=392561 RepID=A0ABW1YFH8_9DEIO
MPSSPKVAQKVARRRQEIYAAAAELFGQGYRRASMRELAGRLGLSKATLYHYVSSKEELLVLLYAQVIAENTATMQQVMALGQPAVQTLREVLIRRTEQTASRQHLMRVFYEEELELPSAVSGPLWAERQHYEDTLVNLVQRAIDEGSIRPGVSARMTANTLLGAVNWTYRWYKPGGPLTAREFAEEVTDLLLTGLLIRR